jgi:hypothetical protein
VVEMRPAFVVALLLVVSGILEQLSVLGLHLRLNSLLSNSIIIFLRFKKAIKSKLRKR